MIRCPVCGGDMDVEEEDLDEGDVFDCTECGANLRVASLKPLELAALDDEDDFEDEDDFDEDEEEEEEDEEDDFEDELEEEEDEEEEWN
jgi:lysine biosynthesis protein LysW